MSNMISYLHGISGRMKMACVLIPALFALSSLHPLVYGQEESNHIVDGKFSLITKEELSSRPFEFTSSGSGDGLIITEIPASYTGTGFSEWIEYMLPPMYNPSGPGHPLMVCWHGYGQTCASVSINSLIDEECVKRNWIFLSITGVIECNFGYPMAQIHCTKAIEYLIDEIHGLGLNVDTSRIYMAGFSMGGGAAASYASRHMASEEGYPVAGLILVASVYDWTDAYNQKDPGAKYWLPNLLGGTPEAVPFAYKQISTILIDNYSYRLDESMGQNSRHNLPVFITFAGNDPLAYLVIQNYYYLQMLFDIGAYYHLDYWDISLNPHSWSLLDVEAAFDFIEPYGLEDQNSDTLSILADRDAAFYWAGVTQSVNNSFSRIVGQVDVQKNKLYMNEANNTDVLLVNCNFAGLSVDKDLYVDYHSTSTLEQVIELQPLPQEPTYVVDEIGVLYSDYDYNITEEKISINRTPLMDMNLKISYENYDLALSAEETVPLGGLQTLSLGNGDPYDLFLLFFALTQIETKVGMHHLLVDPFFPTLWILGNLDGAGESTFSFNMPMDPAWAGVVLFQQFLTYDPLLKEISNLATTTITDPGMIYPKPKG